MSTYLWVTLSRDTFPDGAFRTNCGEGRDRFAGGRPRPLKLWRARNDDGQRENERRGGGSLLLLRANSGVMFGQGKKRNNSSSCEIDHGLFLFPFLILVHLLLANTSGHYSPSAGAIVNFIGIIARRRGRSCTSCYKQRFVCPTPSLPPEVATQHNDASISRVELA